RSVMAGSASSLFQAISSAPPTRASHLQVVMVHPGGGSIQRRILSGVNIASHTSRRGASKLRVRTMVVSVGVERSSSLVKAGDVEFICVSLVRIILGDRVIAPRISSRRGPRPALRTAPPSAGGTVRSRASLLSAARRRGGTDVPDQRRDGGRVLPLRARARVW